MLDKLCIAVLIASIFNYGFAQEVLPRGCKAVVIKNNSFSLSSKHYSLVFVHNLSKKNIWMVAKTSKNDVSSRLTTKLESGKWSSIVFGKQANDIDFMCIESSPGHEQHTSCNEVIAACDWPKVKLPETRQGVYLAAENMNLSSLTAFSERNGYTLLP
jgi:hypothetical protein